MPWFTDHGPYHGERVAEFALEIASCLDGGSAELTIVEKFALVASATLHDVGMQDLAEVGAVADNFSAHDYNTVRSEHPERSYNLIFEEKDRLGLSRRPELLSAIAHIARAHGTEYFSGSLTTLTALSLPRDTDRFRGALLAAILLFADELDLHNARHVRPGPLDAPHPTISQAHNYKHYVVANVRLKRSGTTITPVVSLDFPEHASLGLRAMIKRWIVSKLRRQIALIEPTILSGSDGHLHLARAIEMNVRTELGPARDWVLEQSSIRWLAAEIKRADIVDYGSRVERLEEAARDGQSLIGVGGDLDGRDSSGRRDVFEWLKIYCETLGQVVEAPIFQVASVESLLSLWLQELSPVSKDGSADMALEWSVLVERLVAAIADRAASTPETPIFLTAPSIDLIRGPHRTVLEQQVIPRLLASGAHVQIIYGDTDRLTVPGVTQQWESLGDFDQDEAAKDLRTVVSDPTAVGAIVSSGADYGQIRAIIGKAQLELEDNG